MDNRISQTMRFIETNYSKDLSSRDLTQCARLSRSRLDVLFHTQTGLSPVKYLKETRIRRAAQLLVSDDLFSIKEVMARVGFTDKSNFTRSFKRVFGIAPSEYRQREGTERLSKNVEGANRIAGESHESPRRDRRFCQQIVIFDNTWFVDLLETRGQTVSRYIP